MTRTSVVHCNPEGNCQKRAAVQLGKCLLVAEVFAMLLWQSTRHEVELALVVEIDLKALKTNRVNVVSKLKVEEFLCKWEL